MQEFAQIPSASKAGGVNDRDIVLSKQNKKENE